VNDTDLQRILTDYKRIAIVGLSANPSKPSHGVAEYLLDHGYDVTPVNPNYEEILGRRCYADLTEVPTRVEIVNLFQRSERVPPFVDAAIDIGANVVWMQLEIVHEESAEKARAAGLEVVTDRCIRIEHARLVENIE
jgi:predicted CoA-binding protein